jgi:GT2 family glycosyltransferase
VNSSTHKIAAVVIGRNEGQRLVECIASIRGHVEEVVYVDSGSTDGSPERAEAAGATGIRLESGPYTAARGRQAGVDFLAERSPELILFVDGDCTLDAGFVAAAVDHMARNPRTGAVAGRRREVGSNFWSRVIDIEWDTTPGPMAHVGGDSLMRTAAIGEAGGWPVDVIAGEEPDLCLRMKDCGWDSYRIPVEMTLHDIRMKRFGQYWKRSVRAGHAYAEVAWRRRKGAIADRARAVVSIILYSVVVPALMVAAAVVYWPVAVVLGLLYVRVIASMTIRTKRAGRSGGLAFAYAVLTVVGKFAGLMGVLRFALGVLTGKRSRIIEYQTTARPNKAGSPPVLGKSP